MKKIIIIGAGGQGRETAQLIKDLNREKGEWELLGYLDDNPFKTGERLNGHVVLGTVDMLAAQDLQGVSVVCAVGQSKTRKKLVEYITNHYDHVQFATLIHPTAVVGDEVVIGEGVCICANSVVSTNIHIGDHALINYGCTIGHDAVIEPFVTVLPGCNISGGVVIRTGAEIGTGSAVIQGVEIGSNTIVGAGAVVTKTLPESCVAVGVPAKPIVRNQDQKGGETGC